MKIDICKSVVMQASASGIMFLCIGIIGYYYGADVQGLFSLLRSETELVAALGAFGLPQAIFYFVGKEVISKKIALLLFCMICVLVGIVSSIYYHFVANNYGVVLISIVFLSIANASHNTLRYLLLATRGSMQFNIASSIPSIVAFSVVIILIVVEIGNFTWLFYALLLAYASGSIYSLRLIGISGNEVIKSKGTPIIKILVYSFGPGLSIILCAITPVYVGKLLSYEDSMHAVGYFTTLIMIQQLIVMPVNLASPLLFKMLLQDKSMPNKSNYKLSISIVAIGLVGFAIWSKTYTMVKFPSNFVEYEEIIPLLGFVFISATLESVSRLEAVKAYSLGKQFLPALGDGCKLIIAILGLSLIPVLNLTYAVYVWCVATAAGVIPYILTNIKIKSMAEMH